MYEAAAYEFVEARVWPNGPICPHCGGVERIGKMGGKSARIGTYKCHQCRKPFTVKIGTVFESSHVPLHLWLQAIFPAGVEQEAEKQRRKPPPKPTKKMTQAEQSERFKETARKLGADESGEAFERALEKVIRAPQHKTVNPLSRDRNR